MTAYSMFTLQKCVPPRTAHIVTGLPDAYSRGRIIGDYRRIALYGIDYLIEEKNQEFNITMGDMLEDIIRDREEIKEQIRSLKELKEMAASYGYDISEPAKDVKEAMQWIYFGYLGAIKEQNGAAMSIGRNSTFLDIYAERDLRNGTYTEEQIQEFVDHFIMKLRMVRFARIHEYNNLFTGDPVWTTESIGGMGTDGRTLVSKMSFRYLHTLTNLWSCSRTKPHCIMVPSHAYRLPPFLCEVIYRNIFYPIRKRRIDAS